MVNVRKLKGKIVEAGTTQESLAKAIGINRGTFARKLRPGGGSFTIREVCNIMNAIPLTKEEAFEIFLTD